MTAPVPHPRCYVRHFAASPPAACRALARAAETWGAHFEPRGAEAGWLELPVNAGLRQGRLVGAVRADGAGEGTELSFAVEREEFQLPPTLVGLLLCGAVGAVSALFWPFFPGLGKVAPLGALIALAVWFLVIAKARYVGAEVFLDRVADEMDEEDRPERE